VTAIATSMPRASAAVRDPLRDFSEGSALLLSVGMVGSVLVVD
jgi:hypothetical protein